MTGRQPYTGETPLAVAYAHVNSDVPAVSSLVAGIPPAVDQLVRAATSRDPQQRPPSADVFLRAVRTLRGAPGPAEPVSGSWAEPAATAAGTAAVPSAAASASSHTAVLGAGFSGAELEGAGSGAVHFNGGGFNGGSFNGGGFNGGGFNGAGSGNSGGLPFGGTTATGRGRHDGREPFLQRWLFSTRLAYVAVAVVVLLALGLGGWWLKAGRYTTLPAVTGMSASSARQALLQAGFHVRNAPAMIDSNVPKGDVVSISPSGRAVSGTTIAVTLSRGPRMITVPPVTGRSLADAMAALRAAGLTVSSMTKPVGVTGTVVMGAVTGTMPAAGTSWPQNKAVTIDVVAGLSLPTLTGQDINSIQQWAGANHITLQPTSVTSSKPAGIIVRQSPAPGTPVPPGGTVTVSVSSGPPMVAIPDLKGEPFGQARQTLENLGFTVVGQRYFFGNKVISVSPSGQAPSGSTITVYYGGF
jgi:beta-lactam-binding protein with PASTA domain